MLWGVAPRSTESRAQGWRGVAEPCMPYRWQRCVNEYAQPIDFSPALHIN
jgi:hypothetical protein